MKTAKGIKAIYMQLSPSSLMSGKKSIQIVSKIARQSEAKTLMDRFDHTQLPS